MSDAPCCQNEGFFLQREREEGRHLISKSIYLRQIKLSDLSLESQNLSENRCTGVKIQ